MFSLGSPHFMGFLKGSQELQQTVEKINSIYLKIRRLIISRIS